MRLLYLIIITFGLTLSSFSQSADAQFDLAVSRLNQMQGETFRQSVDSIFFALDRTNDARLKERITLDIYQISKNKNTVAHIRALTYLVLYSDTAHPQLFFKAFQLAKSNNLDKEMDYVEDRCSRYYISKQQYDSAMIHILRMRDLSFSSQNTEVFRNIINLLGDVYYNANLYSLAQKEYLILYKQYVDCGLWNYWRPYVVMNNLGQIALDNGNNYEALMWFRNSLHRASLKLHTSGRNNTLAFTHIKLAETFFRIGKKDSATHHLEIAAEFPRQDIYEDVLQEQFYLQSRLLFSEKRYAAALQLARQLEPGDSAIFSNYRFIPGVYKLLSDIYAAEDRKDIALGYLTKYTMIVDSLDKQGIRARSMIILTERDHEITKNNLKITAQRNRVLWGGLIFMTLVMAVILVLYRKLFRSKMELVRITMEQQAKRIPERPDEHGNGKTERFESEDMVGLMRKMNELMESRKPYLDSHLSIQQAAQMLSTNRTYLSKAINSVGNTTFPNYINQYRIHEAVRLITQGFTVTQTLESLARQCGFTNRTVFNSVFKKHTGVTPTFFIANFRSQVTVSQTDPVAHSTHNPPKSQRSKQ